MDKHMPYMAFSESNVYVSYVCGFNKMIYLNKNALTEQITDIKKKMNIEKAHATKIT